MSIFIHVAVGVVINKHQQVLVALRHSNQHQGGLWEFPGGKVEEGESVIEALKRELYEEVNLKVESCLPLLEIKHVYSDKKVLLDVWKIENFSGQASGKEKQQIKWIDISELDTLAFPEANLEIIELLKKDKNKTK